MSSRNCPKRYRASNGPGAASGSAVPPADRQPQACLKCRSCEQVCPQQIRISEVLSDFSARLG